MDNKKILVMGVGGCGSSFIWGLLRDLGFETYCINGFLRNSEVRKKIKNGEKVNFPKVIKHQGGFLKHLNEHIDRHGWEIEHIFFAVASYNLQKNSYRQRRSSRFPTKPTEQLICEADSDYRYNLGCGLVQLIERDHPFTLIRCPRSIKDQVRKADHSK